ncbi:MAG TPA: hypothetical protein VFV50_02325 [Bdellovibrionales bacterium]|nr:hypothetical protein [Bdellovibrionales bacterium]
MKAILEERRQFLTNSALAALGVMAAACAANGDQPGLPVADPPEMPPMPAPSVEVLKVEGLVANNHGHEVSLSAVEVVKLARLANSGKPAALSIKGRSSHPHTVTFTLESLLALVAAGQISTTSSTDAGHAHEVLVRLLIETQGIV